MIMIILVRNFIYHEMLLILFYLLDIQKVLIGVDGLELLLKH